MNKLFPSYATCIFYLFIYKTFVKIAEPGNQVVTVSYEEKLKSL